jgi:hypothetical protein
MKLGPLQKKWVKTLKAHPERQLNGRLGKIVKGQEMMCCLGQAGVIAGTCKWKGALLLDGPEYYTLDNSYENMGLIDETGSIKGGPSLADLNDDDDHTWPEIAYLIEAAPELFFTKSV